MNDDSIFGIPFKNLRITREKCSAHLPVFEGKRALLLHVTSAGGEYKTAIRDHRRVHVCGKKAYVWSGPRPSKHRFEVERVTRETFEDPDIQVQALDHALRLQGLDPGSDGARILHALVGSNNVMEKITSLVKRHVA